MEKVVEVDADWVLRTYITAGTLLYRAAPNMNLTPRYDPETKKTGIYFATYPALALAIAIETKGTSNRLGVFRVTKDILIETRGKYTGEGKNVSHLETGVLPIDEENQQLIEETGDNALGILRSLKRERHGEVFLTDKELSSVELVEDYSIGDWKRLKAFMKGNATYETYTDLKAFGEFLTRSGGPAGAGAGVVS